MAPPLLLVASLATGDGIRLPADAGTWAAVAYLSLVGSVLAFLVYFSLLKTWSVMSLSFISVFTPVIALLLGFVFLDEPLTAWKVGGRRADPGGGRARDTPASPRLAAGALVPRRGRNHRDRAQRRAASAADLHRQRDHAARRSAGSRSSDARFSNAGMSRA